MARETEKDNMETQDPDQSRPPTPDKNIPSDWSDSEDGKDNQARAKPLDTQDPQPSTSFASYASDPTPLR